MVLSDNDKQEIIEYVNDNIDGESTCDDEDDDMMTIWLLRWRYRYENDSVIAAI